MFYEMLFLILISWESRDSNWNQKVHLTEVSPYGEQLIYNHFLKTMMVSLQWFSYWLVEWIHLWVHSEGIVWGTESFTPDESTQNFCFSMFLKSIPFIESGISGISNLVFTAHY